MTNTYKSLKIPHEIIAKALEIDRFFKEQGIKTYEVGPLRSRFGGITASERVTYNQEHERVENAMRTIRGNYGDMQAWTQEDAKKYPILRERLKELKNLLGVEF